MAEPVHYEVFALRYGVFEERIQADNLMIPDDHLATDPLDFLIFAIRGGGRTIVIDTGFGPESAARRGRKLLRTPEEALRGIGIEASLTRDVVITHMHWDHAAGLGYFPRARIHIQDAEMAYCTGRCMCRPFMRRHFDVEDVTAMVRALYADRLQFHDGDAEIAPGVTLHLVGGHSGGLQIVRVPTARGWVVLAGDSVHFWRNIRERNPFPIIVDMAKMFEAFETVERLADGPDHVIPGHDPLILKRFPQVAGDPDIVRLDLPPLAGAAA